MFPVFRLSALQLSLLAAMFALNGYTQAEAAQVRARSHSVPAAHRAVSAKSPVRRVPVKPGYKPTAVRPGAKAVTVNNPNEFIAYYNRGRVAYNAKHYTEAEKCLKKSLVLAEGASSKTPSGQSRKNVAIISHLTGVNAFHLKKYADAKAYLTRAITIFSLPENQAADQFMVAGDQLILGQIAMYEANYPEAEGYYKAALPMLESRLGAENEQVKQSRQTLADIARIDNGTDYLQSLGPKLTHWTHPEQPIQVYIADGYEVPGWKFEDKDLVRDAYVEWQRVMGNRVQIRFVEDPQQADTVVGWMARPKEVQGEGDPNHHELRNGECQTRMMGTMLFKDDIVIAVNNTDGQQFSVNALHNALLHEIGHSLGLLGGHSSNPSDIMYFSNRYDDNRRKSLTERDINTIHHLYDLVPTISNPVGIHLVQYEQHVLQVKQGADAFNSKDYLNAASHYRNALGIYNQDPDVYFFLGLSLWYLQNYNDAVPYLMNAVSMPGKYQDESLKMTGLALIKSAGQDEKIGGRTLAEQKYRRAYQVLNQGIQQVQLQPENRKAIQQQLSWLNLRLSAPSSSPIQWNVEPSTNTATLAPLDVPGEATKSKKKRWGFLQPSTANVPSIPIMMPYNMMGY